MHGHTSPDGVVVAFGGRSHIVGIGCGALVADTVHIVVIAGIDGQQHTAGGGADLVRIVFTGLACHRHDVFAGSQVGGIHHQLAVFIGGAQVVPGGDIGISQLLNSHVVHVQAVGVQVLGGFCGFAHAGTGIVQGQSDFLTLGGSRLVGNDVVENAVGIGVEIPAGEVAQGDHVAVLQQDLVTGRAPASRSQRILIVDIIIQVAAAAPELFQVGGTGSAAEAEHLGADQASLSQVALADLRILQTAVEFFQCVQVQVQHGHLALGIFRGAGLQIAAGQAIAVIAVGFGNEVEILQAVQGQIEVRNGELLKCNDLAGVKAGHVFGIPGQGQGHGDGGIHGSLRLLLCLGHHLDALSRANQAGDGEIVVGNVGFHHFQFKGTLRLTNYGKGQNRNLTLGDGQRELGIGGNGGNIHTGMLGDGIGCHTKHAIIAVIDHGFGQHIGIGIQIHIKAPGLQAGDLCIAGNGYGNCFTDNGLGLVHGQGQGRSGFRRIGGNTQVQDHQQRQQEAGHSFDRHFCLLLSKLHVGRKCFQCGFCQLFFR